MNRFDYILFDLYDRMESLVRSMKEEERGATDIIAILVMIVVVIAVALAFQERLILVVNAAFDKLMEVFS